MVIYISGLLALIVFFGALLSFVVPLPSWIPAVFDMMLALAIMVGGSVYMRRGAVVG
jgi:uncharacterized membrane protein